VKHIPLFFLIFDGISRGVLKLDEIPKVFDYIGFLFLGECMISLEYFFIAREILKSEDVYHYFTKKLKVVLAVALKIEVFCETVFTTLVKANIRQPFFD